MATVREFECNGGLAESYTRHVTDLVLDAEKSRVRIHTFAEGLLARLAHDLELSCGKLSGSGKREGDRSTARIEAPIGAIAVAGVLKGDRLDEQRLSPSDRREVLEKMKRDVFHAPGDGLVVVEATLEGGGVRIRLTPPKGRPYDTTAAAEVREEASATRASGSFDVSLARIGSDAVKGPMGAFRMKDRVQVHFDLLFRQPA